MTAPKGHFRRYRDINMGEDRLAVIDAANKIIDEYESKGYSLTLRQLYYQFVARGLLPNQVKEYNRLGDIISDGRLAGLVSWTAIEDRTRNLKGTRTFTGPAAALKVARASYKTDKWVDQEWRPEVWVEKEALAGVIEHVCYELGVDSFACRGYNSQSEQWRAGQRFASYVQKGQRPIVFHLGDHDPSGIDMTRDNRERLEMFAGTPIVLQRLALNYNQVEQYDPPPNPAKMTDSRAADYVKKFGPSSWELDALDPEVIANLIRSAVLMVRNEAKWSAALAKEADELDTLDTMIEELGN